MNASDKTKDARVIEELELAWSARMSKFYEDLASGKATYKDMYKYFTLSEIRKILKDGILKRLQFDETSNTYRITYISSSANTAYFIEMSSEGKATIKWKVSAEDYKLGKYGNDNDKNANYYYEDVEVNMDIYVFYYEEDGSGTLVFNNVNEGIEGKVAKESWNDIGQGRTAYESWQNYKDKIKKVIFLNKIYPRNTKKWFYYLCRLNTIENIENLNTKYVTDMSDMFSICFSLTSLDLSSFDTSNVTDMSDMFFGCSSLTNLDLSSFDTSNVESMNEMFRACSSLTSLDLSNFDTSNVESMSWMFGACDQLISIFVGEKWVKPEVGDDVFWRCGTDHVTLKPTE